MLWPTVLPNVALFTALNGVSTLGDKTSKYSMSRYKFFWMIFFAMFVWQWIPGFFATTLGAVSILCLLTENKTVRFLASAGPNAGVGLFSFSFDWSLISVYQPVALPWWATVNWFMGNVIWTWLVVPICYYTNHFGTPQITSAYEFADGTPFGILNNNKIFNATGHRVFIRRPSGDDPKDENSLLDMNFKLDMKKYEQHKPFFLTEYFAISYLTSFMNIATIITHVALWYGKDIVQQTKAAFEQLETAGGMNDTHNRLMREYRDIPEWIYGSWLIAFSILTVIICIATPFYMPWWASIFAIILGIVFTIPVGIVQAISGTQIGLNVITEFLIGLIIPGETVAVATFKSLGYNTMIQALALVADLKLGHYMHISPISMVIAQLVGTLIGVIFNTGGVFFVLDMMTSPKIFSDAQWLAVGYNTFLNAAGT
jgi:hypothetical protein